MSGAAADGGVRTPADPLRGWKRLALASALVIVLSIPLYALLDRRPVAGEAPNAAQPAFVGRAGCL
ncbi:MAG TPA: hypothetical protein VIY27_11115, partial [Myxococcota bacterium]